MSVLSGMMEAADEPPPELEAGTVVDDMPPGSDREDNWPPEPGSDREDNWSPGLEEYTGVPWVDLEEDGMPVTEKPKEDGMLVEADGMPVEETSDDAAYPAVKGSLRTQVPVWQADLERLQAEVAARGPIPDSPPPKRLDPLSAAAPAAKRKRGTVTTAEREDLMATLLEKMGGVSIANHTFARHRLIKHDVPTTVTLLVAPSFALALNQTAKRLETHTFAHGLDGGLTVSSVTPLENSNGYNLSALPLLSHTADLSPGSFVSTPDKGEIFVAALDHLGRVKVWDAMSGKLLFFDVCSIRNNAGNRRAFTEPAAFALSATHLVVTRAETPTAAITCVLQWAPIPMFGEYGGADEIEWDQFTQQIRMPQYLACCPHNPFEFYLASHDGLAKINTLAPASFRAYMPLMSWYAAVTESETGDFESEATEAVIATATAYAEHLMTWSDVPTRKALATKGTFWDMDYDAGKMVMIHAPPPKEANPAFWAAHAMVEAFGKYVTPLRDMPLGAVPAAFRANHVSVTKDHIVVSCESRIVWTDIETIAHCITDACDGSIAAMSLGNGVVSVTTLPTIEFVEMPTAPGFPDKTTSSDLRISSTAMHEPRALLRPVLKDGVFVHRGAPPGTTLAVTKAGHIIVHTFDEHIFVYSIVDLQLPAGVVSSVLEEATLASFAESDDEDFVRGDPRPAVRWSDDTDARAFLQRTPARSEVIDFMTGAPPSDTRTPKQVVAAAADAYSAAAAYDPFGIRTEEYGADAAPFDGGALEFMTGPDGDMFE